MSSYSQDILKFPSNLEELKLIASSLMTFKMNHPIYVHTLFFSAYLYKQTFAIPGSVFLVNVPNGLSTLKSSNLERCFFFVQNLLSGALYGPLIGTALCCLLTASGASMCYFLSLISGTEIIMRKWPDKLSQLRHQVSLFYKYSVLFFLLQQS